MAFEDLDVILKRGFYSIFVLLSVLLSINRKGYVKVKARTAEFLGCCSFTRWLLLIL